MRGVGVVEDVDEDSPPQDGRVVGDDDDDDSPPGGKFPRRNRSAGGQKCSCPSSASRRRRFVPRVLSLFFSRSKPLIYQKMGTGGGPRRPQPTRVPPFGVY